MPPKRGRSGAAGQAAAAPAANSSWESGLRSAQFEECSWRACVSLLAGGTPADEELIRALQLAVQQPQRRLFTLLSRDDIEAMILDLGNPKAKRPKDVPMYYEVTEPAKVLLDAGEDVPCELMAFILKFQLLQVKASDQHRRVARQGSEEKAQSKAGPASATKRKPSDNKAQKAPAPEGSATEKQTQLKRRGEDAQTLEVIDDEPEDGPQHYILLTGFYQAQLLPALEAVGVHVDHVIKVEWECAGYGSRSAPEDRDSSVLSGAKQQGVFWSTLGGVLECGPALSKLHDVARLSYTVADRFNVPGPTVVMFPPENGESVAKPELDPNPLGIHSGLARCMLENFLPLARTQEERRRMLENLLPEEERRRMLENLLPEEERRRMLDSVLTLTPGQQHSKNTLSLLEKLDIFQRSRLRSFSEYRYTEHHDPNVFPQVLQSAIDVSLCVDSFHSPLDHTLYIVCHSPRSPQRHCYESWETVLHTDVAFRKYQEHVANVISDWTRHEETKREAKQIKNLSLLESPHGSESPYDTTSVTEETSQEPCIREESLKAWKLDQEQRQQEAEPGGKGGRDSSVKKGPSTAKDKTSTRPKKQEAPGCPTATPPAGQDQTPGCPAAAPPAGQDQTPGCPAAAPPAGQDQTPGCPAAAPPAGQDQTPGCPAAAPPAGQDQRRQPTEDFHGYRMDGQLIHVSGHLQHLFPSDGGRVTVEKVSFVQAVTHGQRNVLVRQNIPAWQDGVAVAMPAELSRVITSQGAVVRHMKDGSTEVLFPDGAVTFSPDSGPVWPPVPEPEQEETEGGRGPAVMEEEEVPAEQVVLVERDGSADVMMFPERGKAHVFLADGTVATGDGCGVYQVFPSNAGRLLIGQDGMCPSAISIVRPVQRRPAKHDLSIVPINLRNRSWLTFPRAERKSWGPPFGSDLGRGLALRGGLPVQGLQVQDYPGTPQVLQVQELTVFPPTSKMLRHTLDTRLKGFMERLLRREQLSEDMRPLPQIPDGGRVWDQRTAAPKLHSDAPKECSGTESERRTETQWAQRSGKYRQELNEDRAHRSALRSRDIVSYFNPENALLHQMCFTKSPT
ncbi:unnamed protein product [Lota lota]